MNEAVTTGTEQYMQLGALGISFLTLIGIVVAWVRNIGPAFNGMKKVLEELRLENSTKLDNNTKALEAVADSVEEVAKSNLNVAAMVNLLSTTLDTQVKLIEKHDLEADGKFKNALDQLRQNHIDMLKVVEKNGANSDKQHMDIVQVLIRHDDRSQRIETEVGRVKGKAELILTELNHK